MTADIRQQARNAARGVCQWVKRNPLKLSGICGCAAGTLVIIAGASSFTTSNPGLIAAGVLEWSSFGTTAIFGQGDKNFPGMRVVKSVIGKTLRPWNYPFTSNMVQQGVCGVGYAAGGIWNALTGDYSLVGTAGLVLQGAFCIAAPFVEQNLPERPGWRHPRNLSAGCLFASSIVLLVTALQTGNNLLARAALCFIASNVLQGVSRRQEANPPAAAPG